MAVLTPTYPTTLDTLTTLGRVSNFAESTVGAGGVNSSATTVPITDTAAFPSDGVCVIGNEAIAFTGKTGTSITGCTRGFDGTTAASHAAGDPVYGGIIISAHYEALRDTILAIETKLGVGSNSPGWDFIDDEAFTTATSVIFDGVFTSAYRNYVILANIDAFSGAPLLNFRFRAGGSDDTTGYDWFYMYGLSSGTAVTGINGANAAEISIGGNYLAGAADVGVMINVFDPQTTRAARIKSHASGWTTANVSLMNVAQGMQRSTTQFDGFKLLPSTGNMTGKVWVYGVKGT